MTWLIKLSLILLLIESAMGQTTISAESDPFIIDTQLPMVTLVSPDSNDQVFIDDGLTVLWSASDDHLGNQPVNLFWSFTDPADYDSLETAYANNGTAILDITGFEPTNFASLIITITDEYGNKSSDTCDGYFHLVDSQDKHAIIMTTGWNIISSFVIPNVSSIDSVFQSVVSDIEIVKDGSGNIWWPSYSINTIGNWNYQQAYQVAIKNSGQIELNGAAAVNKSINLHSGWNLSAYLSDQVMATSSALETIMNNLELVKNNSGKVYWPEYGINTIGSLSPGMGYWFFLSSDATLTYPSSNIGKTLASTTTEQINPSHIIPMVTKTGNSATLLIHANDLSEGCEIGVKTSDGRIIGSGVVQNSQALITLWGNNSLTKNRLEGANENEQLYLFAFDPQNKTEYPLSAGQIISRSGHGNGILTYQSQAIYEVTIAPLPTQYMLQQNYPNPFNPTTKISYTLPKDSDIKLCIYNNRGELIKEVENGHKKAGQYTITIKMGRYPSGIYFYTLSTNKYSQTRKMLLIK